MAHLTKLLFVSIFVFFVASNMPCRVQGQPPVPPVPGVFVFGDSISDVGNNNELPTQSKADYPPYGIDYYWGPTGRFTNGATIVDVLAIYLGFKQVIPPVVNAKDIRQGVNYASGASGILELSGKNLGANFSFKKQLAIHGITISRLTAIMGSEAATRSFLNKCLYIVTSGSNDYLQNYYLPVSATRELYTPERFADLLITEYSQRIRVLYGYGARKIALFGLGRIGCIPRYVMQSNGSCREDINAAVRLFNDRLSALANEPNANLPDAKLTYINITGIQSGVASQLGLTVVDTACCPTERNGFCVRSSTPCGNRNEYLFFDEYHPTEVVNNATAAGAYDAGPMDASPYNIRTLAQLP
ncbi:hypothetical protein Tsubulata_005387 [Turnera subulata]|uniref:Uncharacterized protein n=1 Tax=Turnera subulata TaxID=218843 RepID=A0A9Q0G4F6_9ROSI|nr:hypothetical protein Tsubulata_005387 [Turnera subulata]